MNTTMTALDIFELQSALRSGDVNLKAFVNTLTTHIDKDDRPEVWIHRVSLPDLIDRAAALDELARALGESVYEQLPLFGVPFAVKDNFDVAGMPTTAACPAFAYVPKENAHVVQLLLDSGAILIGKTNLDQFATGLVGVRSPYGPVRNALDPAYVSGGSSSGSAVAVARGYVSFALGTDTAGSGRVPAGFNGIVGLKPSLGLFSSRGVVPACRTLDCPSIFARDVMQAWQVAQVIAAYDSLDPGSVAVQALPVLRRARRVAVARDCEFFGDTQAQAAYAKALEALRDDPLVTITQIDFDVFAEAAALLYQGPWVAERRAAVGKFFDTNADDIHPVVRGIMQSAASFDAVDTFNARYRLAELTRTAEQLLAEVDVLVVPTAPCMPTIEAVLQNPVELNSRLGYYTNFVNLMNMCAIAIPAKDRADGLPAGITLIGPAGADQRLAEMAAAWQPLFGNADQSEAIAMAPLPCSSPTVQVAVVGAHLVGQPLNWQLLESSARLLRATTTSADYRLYALAGTSPPKPGLVRVAAEGACIEVEVWEIPLSLFGAFVAAIPAPLGIGSLQLADGRWVKGFICEPAGLEGALDITDFKGWRAYRAAQTSFIAH
ncbi:Allophanate hydrolase [Pseudomonas coronafaciens pv. porri]|nr:Allophanate hydrolase [Pseudomonas coronafaciens pv. porri]RMN34150.1 Allophanate hydrolase [Pseudomonas coronafaciens pv. zizaniae]RMU83694.1 Allophanate hydrolase [Pseudomonas coronafaciens pv. porri]RMV93908.1 Allophanate hydrolase [Pseudomonas coronafaciens pv. porri]RMW05883.1 Allophanate hydrolase [Pseudomonas coronafaciens pv. porri]